MKLEDAFNSLMSIASFKDISNDLALEHIAQLTDISFDLQKVEGAKHAIKLSDELQKRELSSFQLASLHYYLANAWAHVRELSRRGDDLAWDWEQDELDKEIVYLRKALQSDSFEDLTAETASSILTNLGNVFDHVGRFVEAIEYWDRALTKSPSFAMARGNRGFCLALYAGALYDQGHKIIFFKSAHNDLKNALAAPLDDGARAQFDKFKTKIESMLPEDFLRQEDPLCIFSIGSTEQEIGYRQWCLDNRLFLNPLNDIGPFSIGAQDVLSTPSMVVATGAGPNYQGFFNQMKQEFVSARYLYYEGIRAKQPHFSDRDVLLINTLDYPAYSLSIEKVKAAYRIAYSLFDKIAYFLNHYLQLFIPDKKVTFRTFWYEAQSKNKGLKSKFRRYQNWPLRGLYWLSKDLYEDKPGFKDTIEPDAQELSEIRNHLEHKYFKLHDYLWPDLRLKAEKGQMPFTDTLAFSISRREFEAKTLRLLQMMRAALIYLSLGIHCEEQQRAKGRGTSNKIGKIFLRTLRDDWKA